MANEYPIDLGKEMGGPGGPIAVTAPEKPGKQKYYPCLYLDWDDEYDLPESGVMEVRFKKKSETTRSNSEGKSQSVELEIREILDVESEADEEEESGSSVLDKYRKETK